MRRGEIRAPGVVLTIMSGAMLVLVACVARMPSPGPATEMAGGSTVEPLSIASTQTTEKPANAEPVPPSGCTVPLEPSPEMTKGPYFKAGSPERTSLLEVGTAGDKLVLAGFVLSTECEPIANAMLDFWQADGNGVYDNAGYRLRGHQFTDARGHYELMTVVPGLYPGRTEHIHVKVQPPSGPGITTQLFFPNVQANQADPVFDSRLLVSLQESSEGWLASLNFIIRNP